VVFEKVGWVLDAEELWVQSRWWRGLGGVREARRWLRGNGWDGFGVLGLVALR
jgi:hypothetical protein